MKTLILLIAFMPMLAMAHDDQPIQSINNISNVTNIYNSGAALAISTAQLQFDSTTYQTQVGVGVGSFDGSSAVSLGVAKRLCERCPLLNGSVGLEDGKTGMGAGATWRF